MGGPIPKQYLSLAGKPVLYNTIHAFFKAFDDIHIILVHAAEDMLHLQKVLSYFTDKKITLVHGGKTRFHSVKNGLQKIKEPAVIFVHDGVRPLISTDLIHQCYTQALEKGNAIPALPLKDSIRELKGSVNFAADRNIFRAIQTPQTFLSEILLPAFDQPYEEAFTDEATVVEKSGHTIYLINGQESNIKITSREDLWLAEEILQRQPESGR